MRGILDLFVHVDGQVWLVDGDVQLLRLLELALLLQHLSLNAMRDHRV